MNPESKPMSPVRRALRAFFSHDVKLRKADGGVRLVFEDPRDGAHRHPTRAEQQQLKDQRDLERARDELAKVLDALPGARRSLRQLAYIEYALEKKGWRGLYKVPYAVLPAALEQLESQVTNWSAEGLACLRSKIAVAVGERAAEPQRATPAVDETHLDDPAATAVQVIEHVAAPVEGDDAAALMAAYATLGLASPAAPDAPAKADAELQS